MPPFIIPLFIIPFIMQSIIPFDIVYFPF